MINVKLLENSEQAQPSPEMLTKQILTNSDKVVFFKDFWERLKELSHNAFIYRDNPEATATQFRDFLKAEAWRDLALSAAFLEQVGNKSYEERKQKIFDEHYEEVFDYLFDDADTAKRDEVRTQWYDDLYKTYHPAPLDMEVPFYFKVVIHNPVMILTPNNPAFYNFETIKRNVLGRHFEPRSFETLSPEEKAERKKDLKKSQISPSFRGDLYNEAYVDSFIRYALDNELGIDVLPILSAAAIFKMLITTQPSNTSSIDGIVGNPRLFICYSKEKRMGRILVSPRAAKFGGEKTSVKIGELATYLDCGSDSLGAIVRTRLWKWQ